MTMALPNDHLRADPGYRFDAGHLTTVDLSELPASLQMARRGHTQPQQAQPQPQVSPPPQVDLAAVAGLVQALQAQASVGDPGDPSSSWTAGAGKGDYGMAGNVVYGTRPEQQAQQLFPFEAIPVPSAAGPSSSPSPATPVVAPGALGPGPSVAAPSAPAPTSAEALAEAYNALLVATGQVQPAPEQVVARLPVKTDVTHADGHVYVEAVVPYPEARLVSVAGQGCKIAAVAVDSEFLFLASGSEGSSLVNGVNAPEIDDVMLTEGDRIGVLVRFPPSLGLVSGFVDITLLIGAKHTTVR